MNWLELAIAGLATFRLSLLVSSELGPGRIFQKLRLFLKKEAKQSKVVQKTAIHRGVECHLCNSYWWSLPIAAYCIWYYQIPEWGQTAGNIFLLWNALSGISVILKFQFAKGF